MRKPFTAFHKAFLPVVMLLIFFMVMAGCSVNDKPDASTPGATTAPNLPSYNWPATGLASVLPQPESAHGQILTDEGSVFKLEVYDVTPCNIILM